MLIQPSPGKRYGQWRRPDRESHKDYSPVPNDPWTPEDACLLGAWADEQRRTDKANTRAGLGGVERPWSSRERQLRRAGGGQAVVR